MPAECVESELTLRVVGGTKREGFDNEFEQGLITNLYEQDIGTTTCARIYNF